MLGLLVILVVAGCQSSSGPAPSPDAAVVAATPPTAHPEFSAKRALADWKKLDSIGSRETGSRGSARARSFIRSRLEKMDAEVEEYVLQLPAESPGEEPKDARTLVGVLPGASEDVFLLVSHYDTWPAYGDDGALEDEDPPDDEASAAALVLELGRAIEQRPLPYTVWLVFVDGDGHGPPRPQAGMAPDSSSFPGSDAFVASLIETDVLDRVRLAVYFDRVGAEHLMIARDLRSHRVYRETFWESARDLHGDAVFAAEERPVSVAAGHEPFIRQGMRRAVALVASNPQLDLSAPAPPPPSACCAADSLRTVGVVSLEALERIADRLDRIDRFSRSPLAPVPTATRVETSDSGALEGRVEPRKAAPAQ